MHSRFPVALGFVLTALFPFAALVHAAPGDMLLKIPNPDLAPGAEFGDAIAAFDGKILVGAPNTNVDGTFFVGQAYVFDATTGEHLLTIPNPVVRERDQFGASIVGVGDKIVVGAVGPANSIYVFDAKSGELLRHIPNPNPPAGGSFGAPMAVVGENVFVGAGGHSVGAVSAGAAYLISPHTGELVLPVPNPEPHINDLFSFGLGVAALGDNLVVGAFLDDLNEDTPDGDNAGRVWVFDGQTGEELLRIENPQPEKDSGGISDWFGFAVAAAGEKIIVGARLQEVGDISDAGTVYVFDGTDGELLLTIPNPEPGFQDYFGRSVASVGGDILVGAWGDRPSGPVGTRSGSAYLFDGTTGRLLLDISNPDDEFDQFGWTVAGLGDDLLIGALVDAPDGATVSGSVYVYEGVPEFLLGDTNRDGTVNIEDLNHVRNNFGALGQGLLGDTNGDKSVDIDDLNNVRNQFGRTVGSRASVPEPSGMVIAIMSSLMVPLVSFSSSNFADGGGRTVFNRTLISTNPR